MEHFDTVDDYLAASERWPDAIRVLRPVLLAAGLDEVVRWGKPCYAHGGAIVVIVQEFAEHLALLFPKGILLDDPAGVLVPQGPNSHGGRRILLTSTQQAADLGDVVADVLERAVTIEEQGRELPPRPELELVAELTDRLEADPLLRAAFEQLTPGRQRGYHLHVSGAKQATTRAARVDRHVERILSGRGLRDR
jgi:uncharacterized protein YdeI (YjbR/CyaY-like superfamily)